MATLRREWVSVEQAQQWIDGYDPKWMSNQVADAIAQELEAGKKRRWYHAIIVDQHTNICHESLTQLLAIVKVEQGQMCWVARADDFHFSEAELERTAQGYQVITRKMDRVETTPLNMPFTIIDPNDLPEWSIRESAPRIWTFYGSCALPTKSLTPRRQTPPLPLVDGSPRER
jgi:hypothetical protein